MESNSVSGLSNYPKAESNFVIESNFQIASPAIKENIKVLRRISNLIEDINVL